MDIGCAF
ncbi:hypothetical protein D049_3569A, partial [Vibrio parahaemolyticus VPTS-2010]